MTTISFKPILTLLFVSALFLNAAAQKLPNVQPGSVRAPTDIKIDGKATEWSGQLQAYNHATEISYTVSNDENYLYLTVQAVHRDIINKIMHGGITFTIQPSGKKTDKGGISVTYPLFDKKNRPFLPPVSAGSGGAGEEIASIVPAGSADRADGPKGFRSDSLMRIYNKSLTDNSKYIGVTGVKGLDSLISIYNADGIKAAQSFAKTDSKTPTAPEA